MYFIDFINFGSFIKILLDAPKEVIILFRNKNLYENFSNQDTFSDRLIFFLFHFAFFLMVFKKKLKKKYFRKYMIVTLNSLNLALERWAMEILLLIKK